MRISKGLRQGYDLQDLNYNAAMALKQQCCHRGKLSISREDASAIAALTKSWELATERVRILRGKPLPGVLRPEPKPQKKRLARVGDLVPSTAASEEEDKLTGGAHG